MKHRKLAAAVAAAVIGSVALVGCGGSPETTAGEGARAPAEADRERQQPGAQEEGQKKEDPKVGRPAREVVHSGELRIEVKDLTAAADKAVNVAKDADGFVGDDERNHEDGEASAKLTLRIPAKQFSASLDEIAGLGAEVRRQITAEDVSDAVVDLDGRIESQRASVKRVRALLKRAQTLDEISTVERELTKREAELAGLEGRKRDLANRVAYSTLVVELFTTSPPKQPKPAEIGFWAGLKSGWSGYLATIQVALTVFGAVLPFLLTLAVPAVALTWLLRRRRRDVPEA